jgi:hypothetical protein
LGISDGPLLLIFEALAKNPRKAKFPNRNKQQNPIDENFISKFAVEESVLTQRVKTQGHRKSLQNSKIIFHAMQHGGVFIGLIT